MELLQSIYLDFAKNTMPITVFAKQYDKDTRKIEITPVNNGSPYTLDTGTTARLQMTKPDGTTVINNANISQGKITVTLTAQCLAADGTAVAEIGLYKNSTLLSSQIFYIDIQKGAYDENAPESSDEYNALVEALDDAETAVITANAANTRAEAAVTTANAASARAETAVTTANAANTRAEAAVTAANDAATAANAAASTASARAGDAASAAASANNAATAATTAANSANIQAGNAATAATAANNAANAAGNAATAANTAADRAETAETNAVNATINCNSATNRANTALTNANAALAEAQRITGDLQAALEEVRDGHSS